MRIKIFLFILLTMAFAMPVMAAISTGCAILSHNGVERFYKASDLQKAFDDAAEGDTIVLGEGEYYNDNGFTITKKLYIRGSGSYIGSDIKLNISGDSNFTIPLFDYVNFSNFTIESDIENLYLRRFSGGDIDVNDGYTVNAFLDRCTVYTTQLTDKCKSWVMQNSYLDRIYGTYDHENLPTLINCNYDCYEGEQVPTKSINCIYKTCDMYDVKLPIKNSILENCLINSTNIEIDESTTVNGEIYYMTSDEWNIGLDNLTAMKYFGNDGTVVGRNGGPNPKDYTGVTGAPSQWTNEYILSGRKFSVRFGINPKE